MEMMGTKEAAKEWSCKQETVAKWCREGKIKGAEQDGKGHPWRIPIDAECPGKPRDREEDH
ncbi:MAG: helix-turn-helix domain-containing protein [Bacteroides sp.]|nr:helix-turn-helix domain-containing protein [Eubacterium sp.]MCM1419544.1 helix-turn-helix domain-containing protein [Roseburia sp.]MCM1463470.1 helix-turn-helix domain-containing protein [Bacteroides sp.]